MVERIFNSQTNLKLSDIVNTIIYDYLDQYIDDYIKNKYNNIKTDLATSYDMDMEVTVS